MKRLLATAIALSTLGTVPVQAESAWLVLVGGRVGAIAVIEMKDLNQCEEQGALWENSERVTRQKNKNVNIGFECLEGK